MSDSGRHRRKQPTGFQEITELVGHYCTVRMQTNEAGSPKHFLSFKKAFVTILRNKANTKETNICINKYY